MSHTSLGRYEYEAILSVDELSVSDQRKRLSINSTSSNTCWYLLIIETMHCFSPIIVRSVKLLF